MNMTKKTTTGKKPSKPRATRAARTERVDYGRLGAGEHAEATEEFDREFVADTFAPMTPAQRRQWNRAKKPGRPRKPADQKAVRVLITMDPMLLGLLDAAA